MTYSCCCFVSIPPSPSLSMSDSVHFLKFNLEKLFVWMWIRSLWLWGDSRFLFSIKILQNQRQQNQASALVPMGSTHRQNTIWIQFKIYKKNLKFTPDLTEIKSNCILTPSPSTHTHTKGRYTDLIMNKVSKAK